ncbi:hypothetical protein [Chroococcidiopsis sp. SAG 2025]|uniref:hypothetical protein n=1 Tax=Chroococcidiopsis sp. SAG 2025 TaxID=171389 RepID=UPI002936D69A|nr:hypothetical protein [Chroococcidiopsis sp. SAG 2025]
MRSEGTFEKSEVRINCLCAPCSLFLLITEIAIAKQIARSRFFCNLSLGGKYV